jgi:SAM-dependent methyltransferase
MKTAAVDIFACPGCKGALDLRAVTRDGPEVLEGSLTCRSCGAEYAVTRGVPRFVDRGAYAASFGLQSDWFRTVQLDSVNGTDESDRALYSTTGWTADDYRGALVLDAGVGAGRFAEIVAENGGEVVGIDPTAAVDAAYANVGRRERVHLAQADIFAMPFRNETFDLAYSIGMLHHTPSPRKAFANVAATVKPRGGLAVYLYALFGPGRSFMAAIRSVTTRLPSKLVLILSSAAVPMYYVYRMPLLGKVFHLVLPMSLHRNWRWRWLDTFDTYTRPHHWMLQYPEVFGWFKECGFGEIEMFEQPIRMRGTKTPVQVSQPVAALVDGPSNARQTTPVFAGSQREHRTAANRGDQP